MLEDKHEMIALLTGVKSSKKSYYTELKKTVEQLKKKNMQLEIINEVMKSIKIDMSLGDILNNVVDKLRVLVHFDRLSLLSLHNDNLTLTNIYPEDSHYIKIGSAIPNEHSLYWSALKNRQIIFQRLNDSYSSFYEKEYLTVLHLRTILVLPIYSKNKGIGVLSIGRHNESEWGMDDLAFLEQLTDHLAVSIENAQLYNEVLRGKQEWEDTFKAVDDMILVFDKDLNVVQFNDSVKAFVNINEQSSDLPILEESCKSLVRETFYSKKPGYKEIYFQNNSTCELYTYPVYNNEQQVYGVIAYIKDVTEKRKMEVQLLHSGKLAAIGEMAAGIAHELNSPLTAILGNSQLLLRNITSSDPSFTLLNDIKNCGNRCKQIIKSLLTFSRQDEYVFDSCSLNEAVEQVLNLLKYQLEKKQIVIKCLLQENLPFIDGSQPQIEQIIINFLLNARDALELSSRKNKEIIITTSSLQSNEVHLSVKDNGIGIEENRLSEIFHPFHTTKETEKGTGLGLSVSIGIAKTHRGTIEVSSKLNKGSTFTLKLPLQQSKNR
ncbi:GAF domain-containing sensor histidine kinase [Fictibacillus terranigra]|uniref:histidine kinase n=1 Tax=Fictibacillus terranigra TaxID=3058424 RepID=A0ABT8E582_9BACL|nr:GAF domain-containing sensor histidine kinase [Fictibacillus sp. CENA-BCM004]MDN4073039.1 ATP-binding protein [Fictibacillus sp. CENA-BCM004]